jgi:thioester reductase-like protein
MPADIFLTGATGFIGSGLLEKWLAATDARLHLLARPRHDEDPHGRIEKILNALYPDSRASHLRSRIKILEGDVTLQRLGLSDSDYERLCDAISHIIHCAAAARFDLELDEARRINVGGTERILALAERCPRLKKLDYIGTAYVAGRREGLILEDELDEGQEHNNTYERSKLEAERLVRECWTRLPITIFRPSIVICDTATGRTSRHGAFYRVLEMYRSGALRMLPGDPNALLDLVPLDYCTQAVSIISGDASSTGRCYHLTAGIDNLTSLGEIRDLAARHFGIEPFVILPEEQFDALMVRKKDTLSQEAQQLMDEIAIYRPYLAGRPRFDRANTAAALKNRTIEVPRLEDYFPRMVAYMNRQAPA